MHLLKYLKNNLVKLELDTALTPPDVAEYEKLKEHELNYERSAPTPPDFDNIDEHTQNIRKNAIIDELADIFDRSGEIRNLSKFRRDFYARESQSTTAVGGGLAIPHIRSMQPRKLVVCMARSIVGAEYLALDDEPVRVFFCIASPSYDDNEYWRLYRWAAKVFNENSWLIDAILDAPDENEIIKLMKSLR